MFGIADYGAFVVAIIVFLAIPGPGNLALLTATGKGGVRAGLAATLGVIAGDQVLLWLAVAGLSAVLINYPSLYSTVQWVGAAYLMGLGYSLYKVKEGDAPVLNMKPEHYFRQALFITVLNPKAIVFYMAFFPLFVDPAIHMGLLTFAVMAATIAALIPRSPRRWPARSRATGRRRRSPCPRRSRTPRRARSRVPPA